MATEFSFKNNLKAELYENMTASQTTIKLKHLVNSSDPAVRLAAWPRLNSVSQSHPISFFLTLEDKISGECEIIICTGVYANTDDYIQFVCARGMDGTTAATHSVDATIVENREIATFLNNLSNIYWTINSGDIFNSVVSLATNQTIGGVKTLTANPVIKNNGPTIHLQQTDITKGTNPSANKYIHISMVDSAGTAAANRTGYLQNVVSTAGLTSTILYANRFANGSTDVAALGVHCSADGNTKYATAPTPVAGDDSTKIATTEWVKAEKATTTNFGVGRSATAAEVTAGATSGTGPAWVTPEELATGLAGKTDGKVSLIGSRTTNGDWTLTGLVIGKPLIITASYTSSSQGVRFRAVSGTLDGVGNSSSNYGFYMGYSNWISSNCGIFIPTDTTVVINISDRGSTVTVRAYQ